MTVTSVSRLHFWDLTDFKTIDANNRITDVEDQDGNGTDMSTSGMSPATVGLFHSNQETPAGQKIPVLTNRVKSGYEVLQAQASSMDIDDFLLVWALVRYTDGGRYGSICHVGGTVTNATDGDDLLLRRLIGQSTLYSSMNSGASTILWDPWANPTTHPGQAGEIIIHALHRKPDNTGQQYLGQVWNNLNLVQQGAGYVTAMTSNVITVGYGGNSVVHSTSAGVLGLAIWDTGVDAADVWDTAWDWAQHYLAEASGGSRPRKRLKTFC